MFNECERNVIMKMKCYKFRRFLDFTVFYDIIFMNFPVSETIKLRLYFLEYIANQKYLKQLFNDHDL